MTQSQDIHQLEYRWQKSTDMTPVASSMSAESARVWIQRIGVWVRHPSVDAPAESVRYAVSDSGAAALAWRMRDRLGLTPGDTLGGRPVISRVLVGPASLLTPEVAAAVCYAGLPEAIGPQPGTVAEGSVLPPVRAEALAALAHNVVTTLDDAAIRQKGLDLTVAAALSDPDTALCVQLPQRDIVRSPRGNSQAVLLWGLRRTVWPVLGRGGRRGWSFSTFEPPPSDMDPGVLPDIVFRMAQAAQGAPQAMRKELRVRPLDPAGSLTEGLPGLLAGLLVKAYAELGPEPLARLVGEAVTGKGSVERRLVAVCGALDAGTSAVKILTDAQARAAGVRATGPASAPSSRPPAATVAPVRAVPSAREPQDRTRLPAVSTAPRPPLAVPPQSPASPEPAVPPEPAPPPASAAPPPASPQPAAAQQTAMPPTASQPTATQQTTALPTAAQPAAQQPGSPPSAPLNQAPPAPPSDTTQPAASQPGYSRPRSREQAPPLIIERDQHDRAEAPPTGDTLSGLIAALAQGPGSQEWDPALQALQASNFEATTPDDRAATRQLLSENGWYADVLQQQDRVPFHDFLVMVFMHAVIPDLPERQVAQEVSLWVAVDHTPEAVIQALYGAVPNEVHKMDRLIGPALASRWRAEHGLTARRAPRHAAQPARPETDPAHGEHGASYDGRGPAAPHDEDQPGRSSLRQRLLDLFDRSVRVPVSLILAIFIVLVVVFVATR